MHAGLPYEVAKKDAAKRVLGFHLTVQLSDLLFPGPEGLNAARRITVENEKVGAAHPRAAGACMRHGCVVPPAASTFAVR